ncbi:MAG: AAA family ATPase [Acidimicrobiia bacterium]|nr:AAA family ATPase [Acidimicrobiia bacterium]
MRRLLDADLDEASRRWLVGPRGLLAACRDVVSLDDPAFLDEVAASDLLEQLDELSPGLPMPRPSARGAALLALTRVVMEGTSPAAFAEVVAGLVSGTTPPSVVDLEVVPEGRRHRLALGSAVSDPATIAAADVTSWLAGAPAVGTSRGTEAGPAALDLTTGAPRPDARASVPVLTSRHIGGEVVHLMVTARPGSAVVAPDLLAAPFQRVDAALAGALAAASAATAVPSAPAGARWWLCSATAGRPLDVVLGPSAGLGLAVALLRLNGRLEVPLDPSWAFTGAVDASGQVVTLLEDTADLSAYAHKLRAAGTRTVVVPGADQAEVTLVAEQEGLGVRVLAVDSIDELEELARRHDAGVRAYAVVAGVGAAVGQGTSGRGIAGGAVATVWRSVRSLVGRPGSDEATPVRERTRFVGRQEPAARLEEAYRAAAGGEPAVVLIGGEPGVGKSRLSAEFGAWAAEQGGEVHWGRCFEAEATGAYRPVAACLRSLIARRSDEELARAFGREVLDLAILLPELEDVGGLTPAHVEGPTSDDRQLRLYDSVVRLVAHASADRPVVLVLDDLQWADPSSLLLLAHLVRHSGGERLLVTGTYRDDEVDESHPLTTWAGTAARERRVERVALGGLDEVEVVELLDELAGGRQAPPEVVAAIRRDTRGNPLFITEIAQHVAETGRQLVDPATWGEDRVTADLPPTVQAVIGRRLARLSPPCRELLALVAAGPGGCPYELLRLVSPLDPEPLVASLDEAVTAGVLREGNEGPTVLVEAAHPLIRQAALAPLSGPRRAVLHRRLAEAVEELVAGDAERWQAALAYHWHLAGPLGDPGRAVEAGRRAGEQAMARTAYHDGVAHYRRALEAARWAGGVRHGERAQLHLGCAEAFHRTGQPAERQQEAEEAFAAAASAADVDVQARAALVHGGARSTYGVPAPRTMVLLTGALGGLGDGGSAELRARVMSRLAQELYHTGRFDTAEELSTQAVAIARATDDDAVMAATFDGRMWALNRPEGLADRLRIADEMVERARRAGDRELETTARVWRCAAELELGRVVEVDADLAALDAVVAQVRVPSLLFRVSTLRTTRALMAGDLAAGLVLAEETHRIGAAVEPENAEQVLRAQLICPFRDQGLLGGVVALVDEMLTTYASVPGWTAAGAFVLGEAGELERAAGLFAHLAADGFASIPRDLAWMQAHAYLAELAAVLHAAPVLPAPLDKGALEAAAADLHGALAPFGDRNVSLWDIASDGAVARRLGMLSRVLGEPDQEERCLRAAVAFDDRTGQLPAAARSRAELARTLRRRGEAGAEHESAELLEAARAVAEAGGLGAITMLCDAVAAT